MATPPTISLPEDLSALTPVMQQYFAAKQQHPDCLMFCRIGDFYELFYDDAVLVARELQLTLTARDREKKQPMCGVPYHAAEIYLQRLLRKGYRIALCEQMEDPKTTRTIVRREVTRVLTPGTSVDPALASDQNNYLASIAVCAEKAVATPTVGLALLDLSTGEFRATEFTGIDAWSAAVDELGRLAPTELLHAATLFSSSVLLPGHAPAEADSSSAFDAIRTKSAVEDWAFTAEYALPLLQTQLRLHSLDGVGIASHKAAGVAAGALIHYLRATKQGTLEHLDTLRYYERSSCLELDAVSVRNLELVDPLFSNESAKTTLFHALDVCLTPMGKRLLRSTLLRPSNELGEIEARLGAVAEARSEIRGREAIRRALEGILDLERLLSRVALESVTPREVLALARTLGALPSLATAAVALQAERWQKLGADFDVLDDLHEMVTNALVDEPPLTFADGGIIRDGVDQELDTLRALSRSGREALVAIEERERQRTGIGSLKVRFNSVFGYYLEVTKANAKSVPADYERKQTLVNAERFTTAELKEYEARIISAQERSGEIERRIFADLRCQLLLAAPRIRAASRRVAEIDLLSSFAHLAALRGWVRPTLEDSGVLEFLAARHPVIEQRMEASGRGRFIPNSLSLLAADQASDSSDISPSILLITGPNMGGKSTYLRQTALLAIMAQCGCFVPAERMTLGLVDRIFTRIGASDNVARGSSTFMVEMTETAAILNTATRRSLILLDEMGRGTATYDGLSLAWATVEHLHHVIGARTLFATHYHELTLLSEQLRRLKNVRVTVKETAAGIVFLHTVEAGPASKSYGIEVARLAGLPTAVIARAREVLKVHERVESQAARAESKPDILGAASAASSVLAPFQMTMFTPLSQRIVDRLAALDIDAMTPREALTLLADLQSELNKISESKELR